ncbi:hypothetical protein PLICRDRAFT_50599 [Plicaturopsis crispa FD-325 SS-3]|nr:hypothetical protein PLICRDRAFT_50599 [Plicaturopsis crispa FD-325 SS-3]
MEKEPLLPTKSPKKRQNFVLVIHGGAGTMSRSKSTPEQQAQYRIALNNALRAGYEVLNAGGEAMDAVVAAVSYMEDCPLFNAGKGAVFNVEGKNELEASLMLSRPPLTHPEVPGTRRGVGLTLLTSIRNPSQLVRQLYLSPDVVPHAFLSGAPAEALSTIPPVDPSYFFTAKRWIEHRRGLGLPDEPYPFPSEDDKPASEDFDPDLLPKGTVGAVALDVNGCLASATSTGGRTNKLAGRVGDTPHMGAGFWAEEWPAPTSWLPWRKGKKVGVAVSGTGDGDHFIRHATASTLARRMQFLGQPVEKAAQAVVDELRVANGDGGVIAVDRDGKTAMPLNCSGMYRGVIRPDGIPKTAIFADDIPSEL